MMLDTGMFVELTGSKYTDQSDYLRRGDVLVTRTQGHTVVVLSDGPRAAQDDSIAAHDYALGDRILKNGMSGADVKELQTNLISLGYSCGAWGADGDFGDATEMAVREFQRKNGCNVDGDVGPETLKALDRAMSKSPSEENARYIYVSGGNCWIRAAPIIGGKKLGVAHNGDKIKYGGQTTDTGWLLVEYDGQNGWISGKYGRIADE